MKIGNVALQAKSLLRVRSLNRKEFKTTLRMSESGTKMHKLERDFRVHSYTQLTMSYYSQLRKKQNFTVAEGTHEMNMANVI